MYTTPQSGQVAAGTAALTLHVGTYRRALLAVIIGNDLFTPAEQLRANHQAHECQDVRRLALWLKNSQRVAAEREAAQQQAQTLANMAEGIARFDARVAAAAAAATPKPTEQPATDWQRNELKKAAYKLVLKKPVRDRLLTLAARAPMTTQQAADTLAALEAEIQLQQRVAATPAQCDEVHRLSCHRHFTPAEKVQIHLVLPCLSMAGADNYIHYLQDRTTRPDQVRLPPY